MKQLSKLPRVGAILWRVDFPSGDGHYPYKVKAVSKDGLISVRSLSCWPARTEDLRLDFVMSDFLEPVRKRKKASK